MNKDKMDKVLTTINWILAVVKLVLVIWLIILVATYNTKKENYEKPCENETCTSVKTKNALLDRYCATRSEYFRSKSAWCKNR